MTRFPGVVDLRISIFILFYFTLAFFIPKTDSAAIIVTAMSCKKLAVYPPNPSTTRGVSTKLSASKDKIVYTNGKSVIVSGRPIDRYPLIQRVAAPTDSRLECQC